MRAAFLSFAFATAVVAAVCVVPSVARADEPPLRSDEARLADVKLDVGLGVQATGETNDVPGGAAVEPYLRFHFGFADPDHSVRRGLALYDDFWFDLGGLGARDAGGFGETGVGFSLLPGFRTDWFGIFFGPSARAQAWLGGGKSESHAFTSTNLPIEARLELFDDPSATFPRAILTGWYAPTPFQHQMYGGRLDVLIDSDAGHPSWLFLSIEHIEGLQYDKSTSGAEWSSTHAGSWDVRAGISLRFD
jgi:hypothetical protein